MSCRGLCLSLVALAAGTTACGGAANSSGSSRAPALASSPATSADGLVGIGASKTEWNSRHTVDPSPPVGQGVAYLPRLGDGADTVSNIALDSNGVVYGMVLNFAANTSASTARTAALQELPPDAHLIFDVAEKEDECRLLQYQSSELGAVVASDPSGVVVIGLKSARSDGSFAPYSASNVTQVALVASGTLGDSAIECP